MVAYNEGQTYIKFTPTTEDVKKANKIIWIIGKVESLLYDVINLYDEYNKIYKKGKTYNNLPRVIKHSIQIIQNLTILKDKLIL